MRKTIAILLLLSIGIIFAIMLSGCGKAWYDNRNIARQHLYNYEYTNELAKDCQKWFPVEDSIGAVVHSENVDQTGRIDSLQSEADSLRQAADGLIARLKNSGSDSATNKKLGDEVIKFFVKNNDLTDQINALKKSYKACKPDTVKIVRVDSAAAAAAHRQAKLMADSNQTLKGQIVQLKQDKQAKNKWIWILGGAWALLFIGIILWQVIKYYTGGAVKSAGSVINKL